MPDYRICSITEDNHIASTPLTIVCDDDQTAIQRSQKLLDHNDVQLWQAPAGDAFDSKTCGVK